MGKSSGKFNHFPKRNRPSDGAYEIDREKLRAMYIDGPDYAWSDFCKRHNFNPNANASVWRNGAGDLNEWKLEWQKKRLQVYDEELTPQIFSTTRIITLQKVKYVDDWIKRTNYMKAMFDAMLKTKGDALRADMENALVKSGAIPPSFTMNVEEMNNFAITALKIQELELKSMLVVVDPEKIKNIESSIEEDSSIPEIEVKEIGNVMSSKESIAMLATYFDQFEKKPEAIEVKPSAEDNKV